MITKTLLDILQKERLHFSDPEQRSSIFSFINKDVTNLAVAENVLNFDRFKKVFQDSTSFAVDNTKYPQFFYGEVSVRELTAKLLSETFKHELDINHLSGVSARISHKFCDRTPHNPCLSNVSGIFDPLFFYAV